MSVCERCHSVIEASTRYDSATGQNICPSCFEGSEVGDSASTADEAERGRSNLGQVFGTLAVVCMVLRAALMLAG